MSMGRSKQSASHADSSVDQQKQFVSLLDLPDELLSKIMADPIQRELILEASTKKSTIAGGRLGKTCKRLNTLWNDEACILSFRLLTHIAGGEEKEANALLNMFTQTNLKLLETILTMKNTVTDCSGRLLQEVTPLQLAYGVQDVEMCEMLMQYFEKLINGKEIAYAQIQDKFPKGVVEQKSYNFNSILIAIKDASPQDIEEALNLKENGSFLCEALKQFRKEFTKRTQEEGIHFNPKHLL